MSNLATIYESVHILMKRTSSYVIEIGQHGRTTINFRNSHANEVQLHKLRNQIMLKTENTSCNPTRLWGGVGGALQSMNTAVPTIKAYFIRIRFTICLPHPPWASSGFEFQETAGPTFTELGTCFLFYSCPHTNNLRVIQGEITHPYLKFDIFRFMIRCLDSFTTPS